MTKEELLAKIKAEIERLKNNMDDRDPLAPNQKAGYLFAIADILSFLSTIESEKPIIPDLEKELARFYLKDLCGSEKDEISEATLHHNFPIMWDDLRDLAHHFAQWGAEHAKK